MTTSDALWEVFKATGHIGAYLLYKQYAMQEQQSVIKDLVYHDCVAGQERIYEGLQNRGDNYQGSGL